jgi:hypothetical protein
MLKHRRSCGFPNQLFRICWLLEPSHSSFRSHGGGRPLLSVLPGQVASKTTGKIGCLGCSLCRTRRYCSAACHLADWQTHKQKCKGYAAYLDLVRQGVSPHKASKLAKRRLRHEGDYDGSCDFAAIGVSLPNAPLLSQSATTLSRVRSFLVCEETEAQSP